MPVKVVLPTALARHTDGQKSFESQAADLPGLLAEFDAKFPALAQNVKDEHGKLRRFINVYVNDEDIRFLGGDSHQFADGDEVMLIPSIAGGSFDSLQDYEDTRLQSAHIEEGYRQAERGELIDGAQARLEVQSMKDDWRLARRLHQV